MGQKQLQRWHLIKMVEVGKITFKEAGEKIKETVHAEEENASGCSRDGCNLPVVIFHTDHWCQEQAGHNASQG